MYMIYNISGSKEVSDSSSTSGSESESEEIKSNHELKSRKSLTPKLERKLSGVGQSFGNSETRTKFVRVKLNRTYNVGRWTCHETIDQKNLGSDLGQVIHCRLHTVWTPYYEPYLGSLRLMVHTVENKR